MKLYSLLFLLCMPLALSAENNALETLITTNQCIKCDLQNTDLQGLKLDGANLSGADLSNAKLMNASMIGANLNGANLFGVNLYSTNIMGVDLRDANLSHLDADIDLEFITLAGVRLEGALFKDGLVCGGFPVKGGFGCQNPQPEQ